MVTTYDPAGATSQILCQKCYRDYYDKTEIIIP